MSNNSLFNHLLAYVQNRQLITQKQTIVIGLSGGPDSVFLAHFFAWLAPQYQLTCILAHLDHGWRDNSAQDVIFCQTLADTLNFTLVTAHAKDFTLTNKTGSLEDAGRTLRRLFFCTSRADTQGRSYCTWASTR